MTLDELRRHLDELDMRLLQTIAERQAMSREVARVKRATGYPTRDYARERDVIVGARAAADRIGVSPDVAETVIRLLIRSSLTTQEQASVVAHGSGSGRRALVIGGAGKMGAWFASFLTSQGFDVEIADPAAAPGANVMADWRDSPLTHDYIVVAAPLGATNQILQQLALRQVRAVVLDLGDIPAEAANRIPLATWFRYRSAADRTRTAFVLLTRYACAQSSAEVLLKTSVSMPETASVMGAIPFAVELVRQRFRPETNIFATRKKPPQRAAAWSAQPAWVRDR